MTPKPNAIDALGLETIRAVLCGDRRVRDRTHADVTWRASGDPDMKNVRVLTGYPAIFSQRYTLYESDNFVITEEVDPAFFDDVLENDCHLNYSHESPSAMCRNNPHLPAANRDGPGSMTIKPDAHGLRVHALVPMDDVDAQRMAPKMDRGVVDQMSYAFTVAQEDRLDTVDEQGRQAVHYTLRKARELFDVTVCPLGANSQTEVALRSLAGQLAGRSAPEGALADPGRATEAGPEPVGSRATQAGALAKRRALLEVEMTLACNGFQPRT